MFAVVKTGGKQYRVSEKDRLEVARIDAKEGDKIDLAVLATSDGKSLKTGDNGAKVSAKVIEHTRGDKIVVFKKKRRQNYRRTQGHRQDLTVIEIDSIKAA
jgi:large subunit ribosomal protein L21